jgi:hypothetical protein
MNVCPDCTRAKQGEWGGFHAHCQGCKARALIRSPLGREAYLASERLGRPTQDYRTLLERTGATHDGVKEWAT